MGIQGGGGGGWAGPSFPISRCCPWCGRAAGTEEGAGSPRERGKGMTGGAGTLGQGGSQGKGREVPWKPGRGECPLNSCQVQVVLGAPPQATRPPISPSQSEAAPEGRGYDGQHSESGAPREGQACGFQVHSDTISPSKKPALNAPREPQVLGARVPDRGPEGTISVSYSFEALNAVSSPVPKATSSGRLLKTRHLPSRHIPPPGTCTPLRPKPPLS